jgi:hypothetical protein
MDVRKFVADAGGWLLALLALLLAGLGLALFALPALLLPSTEAQLLARHAAPSGRYVLEIREQPPAWVRSPSRILLWAHDNAAGRDDELASFWLQNDGAIVSPDACEVTWLSPPAAARVRCHGEEQADAVWEVNLAARVATESASPAP